MAPPQSNLSSQFLDYVQAKSKKADKQDELESTPAPGDNGPPLAEATPRFRPGDEFANIDLRLPNDPTSTIEEDEVIEDMELGGDDDKEDDNNTKPTPEAEAGDTFAETPAQRAVGRRGLSRQEVLLKLAVLHQFGSRCIVTLMCLCLQIAHVIPVRSDAQQLAFLEWVFGDTFQTLNIHSCRNLWLVDAHTHYALDRGLIKIVPNLDILNAIMLFSTQVRKRHEGKSSNNGIDLNRRKTFPPGSYPYVVVGVLCSSQFIIPRERLDAPSDVSEVETVENPEYLFSYEPLEYPIRMPQWVDHGDGDTGGDQPDTNSQNDKGVKVTPQHLKGYRANTNNPLEALRPVKHSPALELQLWQDPWLVAANVGQFLYVLKGRVDDHRRSRAKEGQDWVQWQVSHLVKDPVHLPLLEMCLQIYTYWMDDKPKPQKSEGTKAGGSRRSRTRANVSDAPVARPSGSGQNAPNVGPVTRSRSKNAPDAEESTGFAAPITRARSGKGKSKAGTEGSVRPAARAASRKSTRSKSTVGTSNRGM
ncbi:hypothetical protein Moror_16394 [Moniliophthora roreri MCA 2997]|uniref:HNH nuclease domain-containing protein n=2 Tax=Moniliophthora roreri TaxID=221103 RepID=V2XDS0_MONRO|nr:hypothetical protein Moror_16394 [Moniliophthora roreri MCA 2997]KAI3601471.1 hypothetical protein WG66_002549 [Moniliophthora roreri]